MAEKTLIRTSDGHNLQGMLTNGNNECGAVITHPHSLYGGDMDNSVVTVIEKALQKHKYSTLKFNFRGVGQSEGTYGDGVGEQEDVKAALRCLQETGINRLVLTGYSFGSWVNAHADYSQFPIEQVIMVSPPVAFMDFSGVDTIPHLTQVFTGSRDDIAPPAGIEKHLASWNPAARFTVIKGADHFYSGLLNQLEDNLTSALTRQ